MKKGIFLILAEKIISKLGWRGTSSPQESSFCATVLLKF